MKNFKFDDIIVLDMANNHQGSFEHGALIIDNLVQAIPENKFRPAIKFQFRDLPHFIHKDQRADSSNKHVSRFLSTKLSWEEFFELKEKVRRLGLLTICTPFDEASVDKIVSMKFDVIKIASCSADDWPLLEHVAKTGLPIIASTGGLTIEKVDELVSFLEHKGADFSLMHCVGVYPTPPELCSLDDIRVFKKRYPTLQIGWSTHENPDDLVISSAAMGLGASMFERHVGLATEKISLNAYSSSPDQVATWITNLEKIHSAIGSGGRQNVSPQETASLQTLRRGIFAKNKIKKNEKITKNNIYIAFPLATHGIPSSSFSNNLVATCDLVPHEPLSSNNTVNVGKNLHSNASQKLKKAIHKVKGLLNCASVTLSPSFNTEISHHYGIGKFEEYGTVLIDVINREYCKKILVQLAGQKHPAHYHKRKEETFLVVYGSLLLKVENHNYILNPGDTFSVLPGTWHSFTSETGCVFEEISTTHYSNDSVYQDDKINLMTSEQRKTKVDHWGRFQIQDQVL